jgi:hypothetical protein
MDANSVLANALWTQSKYTEAANVVSEVRAIKESLGGALPDFELLILSARINAMLNKLSEAETDLKSVISNTTRIGSIPPQLRARLALGEIEITSGRAASGRARLTALAKDATVKGFLSIARKAKTSVRRDHGENTSSVSGQTPTPTSPS